MNRVPWSQRSTASGGLWLCDGHFSDPDWRRCPWIPTSAVTDDLFALASAKAVLSGTSSGVSSYFFECTPSSS